MQPLTSTSFTPQPQPPSFSADPPRPERSISNYLRLKTNQSVQAGDMVKNKRKTMDMSISEMGASLCGNMGQGEYDLRTQSLIKQYQLKLNKQEQYYGLRQWKLKQEIQNLTNQNTVLTEELRKLRSHPKNTQSSCSLCSDGQVLAHYSKVIAENQEHHKDCLQEKNQLNRKIEELSVKLQTLEEEYENLGSQFRGLNRQLRHSQNKLRQSQQERDKALEQLTKVDFTSRERIFKLESQSKHLQKQLQNKQNEINQNRAAASSQLTNAKASMRSSMLKSRQLLKQDKQNDFPRGRASLNKVMPISDEYDERTQYSKLTEYLSRNNRGYKYEPIKWKYF